LESVLGATPREFESRILRTGRRPPSSTAGGRPVSGGTQPAEAVHPPVG
jgi:hypothetical protein